MTRGRSLSFAVLAAIGAFYVAYGVANGIAFDLWTSGRLVFPSGPPRLEPTLAVGALFGAFVSSRLAGWRGLVGVVAFASLGVIGSLGYFVPLIRCATGDSLMCRVSSDLDFVIPQLWLVPGFVLGVIAAVLVPARIPFRTELEAAGVFALSGPIRFALWSLLLPYVPFFHGPSSEVVHLDVLTALDIVVVLVAALFASVLLLHRAARPRQAGLILAAAIAVLALPQLTYQLRYPVSETLELVDRLNGFFAAGLMLIVTASAGTRTNGRQATDRQPRDDSPSGERLARAP